MVPSHHVGLLRVKSMTGGMGGHTRLEEVLAAVHALHCSQLGQRLLNLGEQVASWDSQPERGTHTPHWRPLSSLPEGGRATRAHAL